MRNLIKFSWKKCEEKKANIDLRNFPVYFELSLGMRGISRIIHVVKRKGTKYDFVMLFS